MGGQQKSPTDLQRLLQQYHTLLSKMGRMEDLNDDRIQAESMMFSLMKRKKHGILVSSMRLKNLDRK
ncbi:hypothetical protein [Caldalkalibacillus mannanilyticus]|uniref:hypothetical protein n=1 Tax=Caldalkalibacillus mannanilyticus TaxID=1418 RepID=UPI000AA3910D|nr:hypothetical protein [Caldalkalibacillus mannanilyticus]